MMTTNEKLTLIAVVLGLIISYLTYKKTFGKRDDLKLLIEQFNHTRYLSLKVQEYMQTLINKGYGQHIYIQEQNMTFDHGLKVIKEYYDRNLSDAHFQKLNKKLTKPQIAHYSKGFDSQSTALNEIEIKLNIVLQQLEAQH